MRLYHFNFPKLTLPFGLRPWGEYVLVLNSAALLPTFPDDQCKDREPELPAQY